MSRGGAYMHYACVLKEARCDFIIDGAPVNASPESMLCVGQVERTFWLCWRHMDAGGVHGSGQSGCRRCHPVEMMLNWPVVPIPPGFTDACESSFWHGGGPGLAAFQGLALGLYSVVAGKPETKGCSAIVRAPGPYCTDYQIIKKRKQPGSGDAPIMGDVRC